MIQMTDEAYDLALQMQAIGQIDYICYAVYCYVRKAKWKQRSMFQLLCLLKSGIVDIYT